MENRKNINFAERQAMLLELIKNNKTQSEYDCAVAVSGGKDSTMIIHRLMTEYGIKNPLLINVMDEFTMTKAGTANRDNISRHFDVDMITVRHAPQTAIKRYLKEFKELLNPTCWLEQMIYETPLKIARSYNINLVFYGENPGYEYGTSTELEIFHPSSTEDFKIIYLGAIHPYSAVESLEIARQCGFKDLYDCNEWYRQGSVDQYAQIDSIGYVLPIWCKFIKFGYQRVSDMACRFVREGRLSKEQALQYIKDRDYILDPRAKRDFCELVEITDDEFDNVVDKFANHDILVKDANGIWRRKDLM